jgi:transposase
MAVVSVDGRGALARGGGCFVNPSLSAGVKTLLGMAQNFIDCDREQLLSPSLREWLPENHLAWFVIDAVKDIDLSAFYARCRQDGWGRAAYDPAMMVAIVLYAYAKGQRSSRRRKFTLYRGLRGSAAQPITPDEC